MTLADFRDGLSNTIVVGERRNDLGTISWVGLVPELDEAAARIVGSVDHSPNSPEGHFEDFRSTTQAESILYWVTARLTSIPTVSTKQCSKR